MIAPFNRVILTGVNVIDPQGKKVASVEKLGAGIAIWRLITEQKVIITFGEIVGLDAHITQRQKDGPTNIQYLIDAFKSKDKNKPPTKFDLCINNIVLRRCSVSLDRQWQPSVKESGRIDFNHLHITDLAADLRLPVMRNDDFVIDLRRLAFCEKSGLVVESITGRFAVNTHELSARDLQIRLPGTLIKPNDISLKINGFKHLIADLQNNPLHLSLSDTRITPADFSPLVPALAHYHNALTLTTDADYNRGTLTISRFSLNMPEGISLNMRGTLRNLTKGVDAMRADVPMFRLEADGSAISSLLNDFMPADDKAAAVLHRLGSLKLNASLGGGVDDARFRGVIESAPGSAVLNIKIVRAGNAYDIVGEVSTPGFELGRLLDTPRIGRLVTRTSAAVRVGKGVLEGKADVNVPLFTFNGYGYTGLTATLSKQGTMVKGNVQMLDHNVDFDISGEADLRGALPYADVKGHVRTLRPGPLNLSGKHEGVEMSGDFDICVSGNNPDNINGYADFTSLHLSTPKYPDINLDHVRMVSRRNELPYLLSLESDVVDAHISGDFSFASLPGSLRALAAHFLPTLVGDEAGSHGRTQQYEWSVKVNHSSPLLAYLHLPVTLLQDLEITGDCNTALGTASVKMDVPYLQQGSNKLIRDTRMALQVDTATNLCRLNLSTLLPNNKGDVALRLDVDAASDTLNARVNWDLNRARSYRGLVSLSAIFGRKEESGRPAKLMVNPSTFEVNDTVWTIDPASMYWSGNALTMDNVCVHRPGQQALIDGIASANEEEELHISLSDIDLDYVFETLNINYVTFGGRASGIVRGAALLSPRPRLFTDGLYVASLTYNNSLLGDALIRSHFNNDEKAVHIDADISEREKHVARIDGNIYVARDSLSIGIDADSVSVSFLQPFMAAFSSQVEGRASGNVRLYGTFKDIDLIGRVHADTLRMKIDITNTWYSASDSVIITPGLINLSNITLRDREGHTALLNGKVQHTYFHNPTFDFAITDARNFLCYDTDRSINPRWWGTIYGNGGGKMHGVPGYISVEVDMASAPGSTFTFVLDDSEEAVDYEFVTFTDRRREAEELRLREQMKREDEEPEFLKRFRKHNEEVQQASRTRYELDLRMRATTDAKVNIVMDPVAGDRIAATGQGALRMTYNSEDELNLYGTYTLAQGLYNFTLQDLIVRDFKIREGSKITFNGDPLRADLSLTAAYRVNTSLTELDKSFATDRELNSTNVPVEALLKVDGQMQHPEISFNLDFPTLSSDVAGKVRSIISTSDMMNRQIIYLLALNRFYTPDYMNADGSNNELASVASTTLSTQLGQMLGQLAPGWTFSPFFRTDKGDFSDVEVDLALSSALFNNRLLLNGNFGYRDASTSNTNFVGDFDIEYLLNPSGTLRLRAYNHFNDQNYYLRSALTTQGIGILYKRDFNRFLPGLFRRKKTVAPAKPDKSDKSDKSDKQE